VLFRSLLLFAKVHDFDFLPNRNRVRALDASSTR